MIATKRGLRVFLCHASLDKPVVQELYQRLVAEGIDAWLDTKKLVPGQDWEAEITRAVKDSDIILVCLSSGSVAKEGFVQKEIRFALNIADEKPDRTIFIIPVRLDDCLVPERLRKLQWVNLYSDEGYEALLRALKLRADHIGAVIGAEEKLEVKQANKSTYSLSLLPPKGYRYFVGRSIELDKIMNALQDQRGKPIIVIVGMGGIGKTTLAQKSLEESKQGNLFESIVWVSAKTERFVGESIVKGEIPDVSFDWILLEIGRQCRLDEIAKMSPDDRKETIRHLLANKRVLIIFDNLETVLGSNKLVDDIFQILGKGKLIITSRHQVIHEHVFVVTLSGFPEQESVVFLQEVAKERGIDVVASTKDENLKEIHRVTGGAPLAMQLIIGQISRLPMATVFKELREASAIGMDYELYQFLFKNSWDMLDLDSKKVLLSMPHFSTNIGVKEADLKLVNNILEERQFVYALSQLVIMSLVNPLGDIKNRRYAIHPLTKNFILSDIVGKWGIR